MNYRIPLLSLTGALALAACQRDAEPADNGDLATIETNDTTTTGAPVPAGVAGIDTAFVTKGIEGDLAEVDMGKLAQANGSSGAVRAFGKALVADHGGHKDKLAALAQEAGLTVPTAPAPDAKAEHDRLAKLNGSQFDAAFKTAMIANHENDIAAYEAEAASGNAKTAALAKATLPVLRNHLAAAKAL